MTLSRNGWRTYFNVRILLCIFLGFTSGLPLFVLINLVQAWLRTEGVNIKTIGLFALIQFPYTWKFVWAPVMDRFIPSFFGWRLGRRRAWMLMTQLLVMLCIVLLGLLSPHHQMLGVVMLASALAFFSASQDIVVDAYRRELLKEHEQGLGAAIHVNAYKVAAFVPGSLALMLADRLAWPMVFMITAAFMLPGIVMTLWAKEACLKVSPPKTLREAALLPFRAFLQDKGTMGALLVLAFMCFYHLGDVMAASLTTSFFLDLGFTKTQVGTIAKTTGFCASIVGGLVGGVWLVRMGVSKGLWLFGIAQILSLLGFAWLAIQRPTLIGLAAAMSAEAFTVGLGTAAFVAYLANTTDPRYTATQFSLFTSIAAVPRTIASAGAGYLVAQLGWFNFFLLCSALALPGMLLLLKVAPWRG